MDTLLRLSPRPPSCTRLPTDPCGNNGCNFWLPIPLVIQLEIFYSFHSKMASTLRTRMHVIHEPCIWPSLSRGLCSSLFRASDLLRKVTGSIIVRDPDFFFCPAFVTWWSHRFSYKVIVYFERDVRHVPFKHTTTTYLLFSLHHYHNCHIALVFQQHNLDFNVFPSLRRVGEKICPEELGNFLRLKTTLRHKFNETS